METIRYRGIATKYRFHSIAKINTFMAILKLPFTVLEILERIQGGNFSDKITWFLKGGYFS